MISAVRGSTMDLPVGRRAGDDRELGRVHEWLPLERPAAGLVLAAEPAVHDLLPAAPGLAKRRREVERVVAEEHGDLVRVVRRPRALVCGHPVGEGAHGAQRSSTTSKRMNAYTTR